MKIRFLEIKKATEKAFIFKNNPVVGFAMNGGTKSAYSKSKLLQKWCEIMISRSSLNAEERFTKLNSRKYHG